LSGTKKRLPDFLVIGVQRAGSTWLHRQLEMHPDICTGKYRKEINYFSQYYNRGREWYESYFEHCRYNKVVGEVSPNYMFREIYAKRIYDLLPEVKLITILRNPIDRAYSHYKKKVVDLGCKQMFMENLKSDKVLLEKGLYYNQISKYLKYFPKERIKVLIFEETIKYPEKNLRNLFEFLGVNPNFIPPNCNKNINPSFIPELNGLYLLLKKSADKLHKYNLSWLVALGKKLKLKNLILSEKSKKKDFDKISKEAHDYLSSYYKKDLSKLSGLLGRDMNKYWGIG